MRRTVYTLGRYGSGPIVVAGFIEHGTHIFRLEAAGVTLRAAHAAYDRAAALVLTDPGRFGLDDHVRGWWE